jgi:formylglycine-generating enzyme required for sulfatase activity
MVALMGLVAVSAWLPLAGAAPAQARRPFVFAQANTNDSLELRYWNNIKNSNAVEDFRIYLDAYPDGRFAAEARARIQELLKPPAARTNAKPPEKPAPPMEKQASQPLMRDCPQCPPLVLIPAGQFNMGSGEMFPFEGPVHQVTIRQAFYMGQREVTFAEWDVCVAEGACAYTPQHHGPTRETLPVSNLDWNDAHQYVAWLSKKTGKTYRLPSESEWEYAARAGGTTTYPWGDKLQMDKANCSGCNEQKNMNSVPTGSYPPNGFGLYDMAGNAAEWVEDCWRDSYKSAPTDGSAWLKPQCQERVLRGGSFNNDPRYLRSASRFKYDFDVRYYTNGFRVVREK